MNFPSIYPFIVWINHVILNRARYPEIRAGRGANRFNSSQFSIKCWKLVLLVWLLQSNDIRLCEQDIIGKYVRKAFIEESFSDCSSEVSSTWMSSNEIVSLWVLMAEPEAWYSCGSLLRTICNFFSFEIWTPHYC